MRATNAIGRGVALLSGLTAGGVLCAAELPLLESSDWPELPRAISNNAVAALRGSGGTHVYSFLGLGAGKSWRDALSVAFELAPASGRWRPLPMVPGPGRLASTAVAVTDRVYIFGGYTVAGDGSEKSIETVHAFDPVRRRYAERAAMPVPVDDSVVLAYLDRYIYLVSGWHDSGNVNLVQLYDTTSDAWRQATPYPGAPVFGHAGGVVGRTLVICDGVEIAVAAEGPRRFEASDRCFIGEIDAADPARIDWHVLPPHPGKPLYRMAATGTAARGGLVLFAGGSDNPYNYDGMGYDGEPSAPSDRVFAYSITGRQWQELGRLPAATMDHRGLVEIDGGYLLVGGMRASQQVTPAALWFTLP